MSLYQILFTIRRQPLFLSKEIFGSHLYLYNLNNITEISYAPLEVSHQNYSFIQLSNIFSLVLSLQWMSFNETLLKARNFGCGLVNLGVRPNDLVGIYSQNRLEWTLFEQGAYCYSLVVVALYDTLGPDACAYIIKQTDMSTVIVEDDKKANMILDKAPRGLRRIISIKAIRTATVQRAKNRNVDCFQFDEVSYYLIRIEVK